VTATVGATVISPAEVLEGIVGVSDIEPLGPGGMPCGRTTREQLVSAARALKDERGFSHLALLTAVDGVEDSGGLEMVYAFKRREDCATVALKVWLSDESLRVPSLYSLWSGAGPLEREVYDLCSTVTRTCAESFCVTTSLATRCASRSSWPRAA
jgi:hypothetical protein